MDYGAPLSYMAIPKDIPVLDSEGGEIGRVRRVLQVQVKNVFDGIVIRTPQGERFVDGPDVDRIYELAVLTKLSPAEAAALPPPAGGVGQKAERTWRRLIRGSR